MKFCEMATENDVYAPSNTGTILYNNTSLPDQDMGLYPRPATSLYYNGHTSGDLGHCPSNAMVPSITDMDAPMMPQQGQCMTSHFDQDKSLTYPRQDHPPEYFDISTKRYPICPPYLPPNASIPEDLYRTLPSPSPLRRPLVNCNLTIGQQNMGNDITGCATERERNRMHLLNEAFEELRRVVPKSNLGRIFR